MILKKYLIIALLIFINFSKAQGAHIIIKYIIKKDPLNQSKHSVSDYMLSIVQNKWDNIDINNQRKIPYTKHIIYNYPDEEAVVFDYKINRNGIYFIEDLLGHEVFLHKAMNGDTITLKLKQVSIHKKNYLGKTSYYLNDTIKTTKFFIINYPEKYRYMGFFDSLAYLHGDVMAGGGGFSFKELNHDLPLYLATVKRVYIDRLTFLKNYAQEYHMPNGFNYDALNEIRYSFYNDLLEPILQVDPKLINEYPKDLLDTLTTLKRDINMSRPKKS